MTVNEGDNAPFFIVGSGRSGSTLLRLILASHSRICIPPETWFLVPLLDKLPADRQLSSTEIGAAVEIMITHYRWPDMGMEAPDLESRAAALTGATLRDVVELVYRHHLDGAGRTRWGDKTPPYIHIVPQLAAMYPGSRFIHLVRDGRDVAKSFQATGWYGRWLYDSCFEWREAIDRAHGYRSSPLADRLLDVRYEDLVLETEKTIRRICDFLGESFEPAMLDFQRAAEAGVPEREQHAHGKLGRAPRPSDIDRWKTEMSLREVLIVEAFLRDGLRQMGYKPRFDSILWGPLRAATRLVCTLGTPLGGRVWRALGRPFGKVS
jgi:hypothetical protein